MVYIVTIKTSIKKCTWAIAATRLLNPTAQAWTCAAYNLDMQPCPDTLFPEKKDNSTCICIFSLRQCTNSPLPVGVCLRKKERKEGREEEGKKKFISAAKRIRVAIRGNRCEGRQSGRCSGRGQGNKWLDTAGYVLKVASTRSFLCKNGVWE